jgi:hypothetical protein
VASEVVEVVFLLENVILREFFAACKTPEDDRSVDLRGQFGAASGVDAVGFALAALLSMNERCADEDEKECIERGNEGTMYRAPTRDTRSSKNLG